MGTRNRISTGVMGLFSVFIFGILGHVTLGKDDLVCAVVVEKTCEDMHGSYPDPNTDCGAVTCATDDYCTTGEVLVVYRSHGVTPEEWNTFKFETLVGASFPAGRLYSQNSDFCEYQDVCEYECIFVVGKGNRCKLFFRTELRFAVKNHDVGPCPFIEP